MKACRGGESEGETKASRTVGELKLELETACRSAGVQQKMLRQKSDVRCVEVNSLVRVGGRAR